MTSFLSNLLSSGVLALPLVGVYVLFAVGIVVIYRASRVLNLAHGALALIPAYLFYSLGRIGLALPLAAALSVVGGMSFGLLTERLVVRRLRRQGPVAQTVGTVAVYGLAVAVTVKVYGSAPLLPPRLLPAGSVPVGNGALRIAALWMFAIGMTVTIGCLALFRFSDIGLAMRAAADNRRAAGLMGVDPDRTTAAAWALGGALAGLAGVLVGTYGNIDAYSLGLQVLPAFVAALIGGLESLTGALAGCALVALVQAEIPAFATLPGLHSLGNTTGAAQLILMIVAFVILAMRGQRLAAATTRDAGLAVQSYRRATASLAKARQHRGVLAAGAAMCVVVLPFLPFLPFSIVGDVVLAGYYLLAALSIVLLTGWVGQISLAQAEIIGVGAFVTALVTNDLHVPFPFSLVLAAAAGGGVAGVLGGVALRVRGLYLAIATLVFAWMADVFLFHQTWLGIVGGSAQANIPNIGRQGTLPYFDFTDHRLVYLVVIAVAALALYTVANLADSKTGRAFFALRGSEVAAASLGVDVVRYKLLAFVASGVIAGTAGSLALLNQHSVEPSQFSILMSLFFLGIAVVGGIQSLGGAVIAALVFAGLAEVFFRVQALAGLLDIVSAGLLLGVLLLYPGGLAALSSRVRDLWIRTAPRRGRLTGAMEALGLRVELLVARAMHAVEWPLRQRGDAAGSRLRRVGVVSVAGDALSRLAQPEAAVLPGAPSPHGLTIVTTESADELQPQSALSEGTNAAAERRWQVARLPASATRPDTATALDVQGVGVRFGGLVAVSQATLEVRRGEIVGLIGPNGAGKTTLFNVISGLTPPTDGTVEILGVEATRLDVHQRARLGVGRTFQQIQLFSELSVFDNLLVATHIRNSSGLLGHCLALPGAIRTELAMRRRVNDVLGFLELRDIADRPTADLPFGTLRMVELARALVTGSELLLLDEPASGLDTSESARFAELLMYVREQLQLSMLLIEHDIATVTSVSDYMYVLQHGRILSEGMPRTVQRDPLVIEAYLGRSVRGATA
jgi:sulfate-transporting ATPase